MKLLVKFNLVFLVFFFAGLAAIGLVARNELQRNAQEEIAQDARLLMEAAIAQRNYTVAQVRPLLDIQMKFLFLPQTVPAYAATELFGDLHKRHPEFSYKEAALNPTNPRDRAVDWEADVIQAFRNDAGRKEMSGERGTPDGPSYFIARPLRIVDPACLACHSTAEAAPATLVEHYGSANGFGWQLNDVIGAQIISVPSAVPLQRANDAFKRFMLSVAAVFAAVGLVLNLMLSLIVIRPVTRLSALANQVSKGDLEAPEFDVRSRDEIGELAAAFTRMRKSVDGALKMLSQGGD
jgi:HAMP domain-containing protein